MLTNLVLSDLQERIAMARLMDSEKISVDIKTLQLLLDEILEVRQSIGTIDINELNGEE